MLGARLICSLGESQAEQARHSSFHFYNIKNIMGPLFTKSPDQAWDLRTGTYIFSKGIRLVDLIWTSVKKQPINSRVDFEETLRPESI